MNAPHVCVIKPTPGLGQNVTRGCDLGLFFGNAESLVSSPGGESILSIHYIYDVFIKQKKKGFETPWKPQIPLTPQVPTTHVKAHNQTFSKSIKKNPVGSLFGLLIFFHACVLNH